MTATVGKAYGTSTYIPYEEAKYECCSRGVKNCRCSCVNVNFVSAPAMQHLRSEVERLESEVRHWKNRHGTLAFVLDTKKKELGDHINDLLSENKALRVALKALRDDV